MRADLLGGGDTVGAACRQPGRFPGRVDAPHLHAERREPGRAEDQDRHERGDRERGLDGDGAVIATQTLVLSARVMMLDSAVTMESPVTTE